jgi:hypothetical protein
MTVRGRVDTFLLNGSVSGGIFDERQYSVRHEPSGSDRRAAAGHFDHLNDASTGADLDPTAVPSRDHVVCPDLVARVYDDLYSVAAHV